MISRSRWYYAFLVITTAGFLVLAYGAYRTFNCRWSEDVGLFNQLCYSIVTDFSFGASIYHFRNCLAEQHFTPIYILFAPLYYFFRSSFTLIALSVLFTTLALHAVVRIAERYFDGWVIPSLFCLVFVCNSSVLNSYLFFFGRDCVFAMGFFSLSLLFYVEGRYVPWVVSLVLASLCTEYTSLVLVGFGLAAFLHRKPRKWIAFPLLFGVPYFLAVNAVVMPYWRGRGGFAGAKFKEYSYLGTTPVGIFEALVLDPSRTFGILTQPHRVAFAVTLLLPLLFFPLLGLEYLLIPASQFLLLLLPRPEYYANIGWWYHLPTLPFVFAGAIVGIRRLGHLFKRDWVPVVATVLVLAATFYSSASHFRMTISTHVGYLRAMNQPIWKSLDQIPKESSVSAQWVFMAEVSARKEAYIYPDQLDKAEYVVLGIGRWENPFRSKEEYNASVRRVLTVGRYGVIEHSPNGDMILKKGYPTAKNREVLEALPADR